MSYFSELTFQYIAGEWRPGSGSWDIIDFDPYTGDKLAAVTVATAEEADQAFRAAKRAQPAWADAGGHARRAVFERVLRMIDDRQEEIRDTIITETGSTHLKARLELGLVKEFLRDAVALTLRPDGQILPSTREGKENHLIHAPVGVVTVISTFNFPFLMSAKSVAAALALGNAVVLKPHQNTPVSGGTLMARLFEEAGLPGGVLNVVVTDIAEVGDVFLEHPVPRVVSFTGTATTGRHIATVAAANFKRPVLELSGHNALIVLDDANLDLAVDSAVFSRFVRQGQAGRATNRVLIQRGVAEEFTARLIDRVRTVKVGDPKDPATQIGPMISTSQAEKMTTAVDQAVREGGTALVRGRRDGTLVEPTLLWNVPPEASVLRQDIFGPVGFLRPFDEVADAVRIANDTAYGPGSSVHTSDVRRGLELAERMDTSMFHINDGSARQEPSAPQSGEVTVDAFTTEQWIVDAFTTARWLSVQHGRNSFAF